MSMEGGIFPVTEREFTAILAEYNKTKEDLEEYVQNMKEWLKKQYHLPQNEDNNFLKSLIILNKFSLEKAKKKLDIYYSVRNLIPEVYIDREPLNPRVQEFYKKFIMLPLPRLNHDLSRVYIFSFKNCDENLFDFELQLRMYFSTMDLRLSCDSSLGDHYIIDKKEVTFGHVKKVSPSLMKKALTLLQKAYSDRMRGVHFLNVPSIAGPVISLVNTFASEKMSGRIYTHKDLSELHKYISKDILPDVYGGTYGKLEDINDKWLSYFVTKNSWLKEQALLRSDETKRIGEPMETDFFGMYGSFRQIKVD